MGRIAWQGTGGTWRARRERHAKPRGQKRSRYAGTDKPTGRSRRKRIFRGGNPRRGLRKRRWDTSCSNVKKQGKRGGGHDGTLKGMVGFIKKIKRYFDELREKDLRTQREKRLEKQYVDGRHPGAARATADPPQRRGTDGPGGPGQERGRPRNFATGRAPRRSPAARLGRADCCYPGASNNNGNKTITSAHQEATHRITVRRLL